VSIGPTVSPVGGEGNVRCSTRGVVVLVSMATLVVGLLVAPSAAAVPRCFGEKATIVGTNGDDVLVGTKRVDVIVGLRGDDTISGRKKDDLICGGKGNDVIQGGAGSTRCSARPATTSSRVAAGST
jgi:Ca2+-binding RTX toxin-like protein